MNILLELQNQLEDAKADYEAKLASVPDIRAAQAAIERFRIEHAELKRQREAEFLAIQRVAKELADAKAEVIRATRALARQEVTAAGAARREAKAKEEAELEAFHARVALDHEALTRRMRREQPNALAEQAAREARDAKYSAAEHAAEEARLAANDKIV